MLPVTGAPSVAGLLADPTPASRLAALHAQGLADRAGLTWVLDRVDELVHVDPARAEDLIALCLVAAEHQPSDAVVARATYQHARIRAERGELESALDLIARAQELWSRSGEALSALRTDLGRMQILDDLGRHREAAAVGEAMLTALDSAPDDGDARLRAMLEAAAWGNVGVAYSFTGRHERSIDAYARSEGGYAALDMPLQIAQQRANRGIELLALGRAREARSALRSAMDSFAAAGDALWAAKCAGHLATAHMALGEVIEALRVLEPARTALAELGAKAEEARVQLEIGKAYLAAGLFGEAVTAATAAAELLAATGMSHDLAHARLTVGLSQLGAGELAAADREVAAAALLFEQVGDRQFVAQTRLAAAEVALRRDHPSTAAAALSTAAEEMTTGRWLIPLAWVRLKQADVASDSGETREHLAQAAALAEQLDLPQLRYACELRRARLLRGDGDVAGAERALLSAVDTVEQLGAALNEPMLRTAFRADKWAAHDELVDLMVAEDHGDGAARACRLADGAKARTLVDLVSTTVGRRETGVAATGDDGELRRLSADLSAAYAALLTASDGARRDLVRERAQRLERTITALRLRRSLSADDRPAHPAAPARPEPLPNEATLAYHVVGADVLAFVVRDGAVAVRRLSGAVTRVDSALADLDAQWARQRVGATFVARNEGTLRAATNRVLGELYTLLIAPVRDLLDGCDSERLVIVPHRQLHRVPFHALHDGAGHLVERWILTVSPTLPAAATERRGRATAGSAALVLAVAETHAPAISREADALRRAFPDARILQGEQAVSEVLERSLPGPTFVHLACHGLFRPDNPLFSALRLTDRWITGVDVLELDLGGAVVTLSACESGRPSDGTAEPVGLAWAFLAAGAAGVIVSQWVVDDAATTELMAALYTGLARGVPPDRALRDAQLALAAARPHPYYWAPFVYVASPPREAGVRS